MSNSEDLDYIAPSFFSAFQPKRSEGSLFSPLIDFLCLGGGFLILALPIVFFMPKDNKTLESVVFGTFIASHFLNHPHFAHSYHIFYRNFKWKAFSKDSILRNRYLFAGIGVPIILISFLAYCLFTVDFILLGFAGNIMAFFVGWHYVKQGYGMLMVSSVLKKSFFNNSEKRILLINTYFVWFYSWITFNHLVSEQKLWGVEYFTFSIPEWVIISMAVPLVISSLFVAKIFLSRILNDVHSFPLNGAISYVTSLYFWLVFSYIHPALIFIVPAFHSLQYLVVVWRYEINKSEAEFKEELTSNTKAPTTVNRRLFNFAAFGLIAGFCGFWIAPSFLDLVISQNIVGFLSTAFIFCFWIFINVHHYFMDNVIWKKENSDVSKHLFG